MLRFYLISTWLFVGIVSSLSRTSIEQWQRLLCHFLNGQAVFLAFYAPSSHWFRVCSGRKPAMASDRSFVISSTVRREQGSFLRLAGLMNNPNTLAAWLFQADCLLGSTCSNSSPSAKLSARRPPPSHHHRITQKRFADRNLFFSPPCPADEYSNGSGNETAGAGDSVLRNGQLDPPSRLYVSRTASPFAQSQRTIDARQAGWRASADSLWFGHGRGSAPRGLEEQLNEQVLYTFHIHRSLSL